MVYYKAYKVGEVILSEFRALDTVGSLVRPTRMSLPLKMVATLLEEFL